MATSANQLNLANQVQKQSPPNPIQTPSQSQILFRSNECNKAAHARHAASPKQIATHHESSMATSANQLNLANQVQTPGVAPL